MISSVWEKAGKNGNGFVLNLNIVKVLLSKLRNKGTQRKEFIETSNRVFTLLLEMALSDVPVTTTKQISGTQAEYDHFEFSNPKLCLVPILRSGEAVSNVGRLLTNDVAIASILLQRNEESESKDAVFYYKKIPKDIVEREVFLVDPMLATGGSSIKALELLAEEGVDPNLVRFVNLVSCPDGLDALYQKFPGVKVYTAAVDPVLDQRKYILPGLGDFGDRFYGTGD